MYAADIYAADTWADEAEIYAYLPNLDYTAGGRPKTVMRPTPAFVKSQRPRTIATALPVRVQ